jgi:hypothetical protein
MIPGPQTIITLEIRILHFYRPIGPATPDVEIKHQKRKISRFQRPLGINPGVGFFLAYRSEIDPDLAQRVAPHFKTFF